MNSTCFCWTLAYLVAPAGHRSCRTAAISWAGWGQTARVSRLTLARDPWAPMAERFHRRGNPRAIFVQLSRVSETTPEYGSNTNSTSIGGLSERCTRLRSGRCAISMASCPAGGTDGVPLLLSSGNAQANGLSLRTGTFGQTAQNRAPDHSRPVGMPISSVFASPTPEAIGHPSETATTQIPSHANKPHHIPATHHRPLDPSIPRSLPSHAPTVRYGRATPTHPAPPTPLGNVAKTRSLTCTRPRPGACPEQSRRVPRPPCHFVTLSPCHFVTLSLCHPRSRPPNPRVSNTPHANLRLLRLLTSQPRTTPPARPPSRSLVVAAPPR